MADTAGLRAPATRRDWLAKSILLWEQQWKVNSDRDCEVSDHDIGRRGLDMGEADDGRLGELVGEVCAVLLCGLRPSLMLLMEEFEDIGHGLGERRLR